jgi:hypothetical protein
VKPVSVGTLSIAGLLLVAIVLGGRNVSPAANSMKVGSVDFAVSNAADAGPGSLRDAILAADRLTTHAHIAVNVKRIVIETALPALVNPHGVMIDAAPGFGIIDAARQVKGAALQINSPGSALHGLTVDKAHDIGIILNAANVELDSVTISNSKVGIVLGSNATGAAVRTSVFEADETAISADPGVHDVAILSSIFRGNTKAAFWFVGTMEKGPGAQHAGAAADPVPERARIIDTVFEKNAQGVVLANRAVLIQKSRFIDNQQSAILILGGAARVEDCEIRATTGTAVSVSAGRSVVIARNSFVANQLTAIMVRDSQVIVERNTLQDNASGIVTISNDKADGVIVRDNVLTKNRGDAITVIGGSPLLQRNQANDNRGAGLRIYDLDSTGGDLKASPQLDANVFKGNGVDQPPAALYKVAGTLPR